MFEALNAAVDPVAHSRAHQTRGYANDDLLGKFLDATPKQVGNTWLRFDIELASQGKEDHICAIRNNADKVHNSPVTKKTWQN
jgi:hypothetical protein